MSNKKLAPLNEVVETFQGVLAQAGAASYAKPAMQLIASTESLSPEDTRAIEDARDHFETVVDNAFNSLGLESMGLQNGTRFDDDQLRNARAAASYVMLAAGDPAAFCRAALESQFEGTSGAPLVNPNTAFGAGGNMDYRDMGMKPALEAYDNKNLTDFLPYSIAFNIYGQRQDEYSELLFKTFVVPPEQAGVEITASRLLVYRDQNHTDPAHFSMGKKNLINAYVDHTLLKDESTKLLPVAADDGGNDAQLVADTLVGTTYEQVAGVSVPTRPYKIGVPLNLIALSQYQPLVGAGAQLDNQDAVDSAIRLASIVVDTGVAGDPAVVFDTLRLPGNQFQRALRGNYREMTLNFDSAGIMITGDTTAVDGSAVPAFAAIKTGEYKVAVQVSVNGRVNTEKGNISVSATNLTVVRIWDKDSNEISITQGAGKSIADGLADFKVAGFTLRCNRTNSNRRTRGLRLDTTLVRERYYIPLGAPLSVARPNDPWQQAQATDLKAIVTAARIRNTNHAVTAQFNIIDNLKAYTSDGAIYPSPNEEDDSFAIGGLGRLIVQPFYMEKELDLSSAVNSTSSAKKAEDVSGAIVNMIRDISFTMLRQSNYQPALEAQLGGPVAKPILFVGTDLRLIRHIMVTGDDRTFTPMFDEAIVKESLDSRMHDKIFLSFVRPQATEPDVLSFGAHIWSTELVSTLQVTRSGESNSIETMVQPRTLHINMMPVCAMINVKGLSDVLDTAVQYHVLETAVGGGTSPTPAPTPTPTPTP